MINLVDTLAPMGDFEIAQAKDISVEIGGTTKMLQTAIDNGEIGGGGSSTFFGSHADWESLLPTEKAKYEYVDFNDDYVSMSVSNRNLLDNPWFTVNQRGQTTLTVGTSIGHFVDRWRGARATYSLSNNGLSIAWDGTNNTNGYIGQYVENCESYVGETATISAIIDGELFTYTGTVPAKGEKSISSGYTLFGNTMRIILEWTSSQSYLHFGISNNSTTAHTIKAVKLEKGTVSTLANDVAPNYAEELRKCQRYYKRIGGRANTVIGSSQGNATRVFVNVANITVPMRAKPTVTTTSSQIKMIGNGESVTADISSIALDEYYFYDNTDLKIRINTENNGMTKLNNYSYDCRFNDAGYIELSADL